MKRFWQNNKRQLIGIVVIILVAGVLTYISYDFMNWISIMLAIPAFSMSFIVLNQFNLGSDLNKAIESELENRRIKSSEIKKFINIVDEELGEVKNSLRNIEKYYTMQNNDTSSKTQIQPKFLTDTRESLEKYKKFQQKTFDFVKKRVSEKEDNSNFEEYVKIMDISARFIANRVSFKLKFDRIHTITNALKNII